MSDYERTMKEHRENIYKAFGVPPLKSTFSYAKALREWHTEWLNQEDKWQREES